MIKLYRRFKDFLRKELRVHSPTAHGLGNVDTCVACGDVIPEGRQVCPNCERKFNKPLGHLERSMSEGDYLFDTYRRVCKEHGVDASITMDEHNDLIHVKLSKNNYCEQTAISMYETYASVGRAMDNLLDKFIERSKNYIVEAQDYDT